MSSMTERLPLDLAHLDLDGFRGRPVAVLGLARTGIALTRFLADRGARVRVYDGREAADLDHALRALEGRRVELRLGREVDPAAVLEGVDLVLTSPSISSRYPTTEPRLRKALAELERGGMTPVVSEVDLFLRLSPASTVGVTGTKGKTTTSALAAQILARGDAPVVLGGNIGTPLVERLPELTASHRVVLELSELQLPTLSRGTEVAVYTHVTADHLDRHGTLEAYRAVKRRLAALVPPEGRLVLNEEDPVSSAFRDASGATVVGYRRSPPARGGLGIADGWIVAAGIEPLGERGSAADGRILPVDAIRLPGRHNHSNVLAATAVGLLYGVDPDSIRAAIAAFEGVEHRLEPVALVDGVRFVNDSQGTQPDAVIAALHAFEPPLVLIAGGRAKDLPTDDLVRAAIDRASAVVLIGESGPALAHELRAAGHARVEIAGSLEPAVRRADLIARELRGRAEPDEAPVATVLLSPAAASFDQFVDYAARGIAFRSIVAEIEADRRGRSPRTADSAPASHRGPGEAAP